MKKKNDKANLEKSRLIFFEIGILLSLSFLLFAFEWGKPEGENPNSYLFNDAIIFEEDIIMPRVRDKKELIKPEIKTIINVVDDNDLIIEDPDFSSIEINSGDSFIPWDFNNNMDNDVTDTIEFVLVEEMPLFMGGKPEIEFNKYISKKLKYPARAIDNGVEGSVILSFVINKEGWMEDLYVYYSAHPDLDKAAMEAVSTSPKWTPGKQRGKAVRVRYYFPAVFKLN